MEWLFIIECIVLASYHITLNSVCYPFNPPIPLTYFLQAVPALLLIIFIILVGYITAKRNKEDD